MRAKLVLFLAISAAALGADQMSKWWALDALKYSCEILGAPPRAGAYPRVTECHHERFTLDLGPTPVRSLALRRGRTPIYSLRCRGEQACLSGRVRLGQRVAGTKRYVLRRDPMDQALLMLRAVPIEAPTLTSGPDGQMYEIARRLADGTRTATRMRFRYPGKPFKVISGLFHFRYVENPGAAWGLLGETSEGFRKPFFLVISAIAIVFVLWVFFQIDPSQRMLAVALALLLAGALGNFIDRARFGVVVDFIDVHYYDRARWPTFNLADVWICVGVGLLLVDALRSWRRRRRQKREEAGAS